MDQAEPSIVAVRETLTTFAHTFPKGRSVPELQQVLTSIGASRDLGGVPAAEIPAEFTKAVTTRVDEILSGNPSAQELRGLLEMVERNSASLPSLTDKPWAAALIRLTQANREIGVLSCDSLAKTPAGELPGRVRLSSGRCVPFKGDTLIETIGGKEVRGCDNIHTAPDGDLAGRVRLSSGRCVPFTGDTLLETIGGKEVRDCDNIHTAPDRDLAGRVQLADGRCVPFQGDTLLETIGGKDVWGCCDIHTTPGGDLAGQVRLSDDRWVPFQGDALVETIGGKEVRDCSSIHTTPDGELRGNVQLADGQWVSLFDARHGLIASA